MGFIELNANIGRKSRAFQEAAKEFGREVMRPAGIELDRLKDPADVIAKGSRLWDVFRKSRELGFHKLMIPRAFGGLMGKAPNNAMSLVAEQMGYEVAGEYEDAGLSGRRTDNRPGLQAALDHATGEGAALVVYSLSRLGRSTRDVLALADRLARAGADLVSLSENIDTTSAAGKMVFRMLAVLSEFERDLVSERTAAALSHKRALGYKTGGTMPFGYSGTDDRGRLIEDPEEREAIALMVRLREGGFSLRAIGAELDRRGVRSKTGGKWSPQAVKDVIEREMEAA